MMVMGLSLCVGAQVLVGGLLVGGPAKHRGPAPFEAGVQQMSPLKKLLGRGGDAR